MRSAALAALLLGLCLPASADIFLVRHADKKTPDEKSLLSSAGLKRAGDLARVLSSANIKAVYVTEYERTRQTAAPTAAEHGLTPIVVNSDDVKGLAARLRALPPGEDALVVGHSDTVPDLLTELGVSTKVAIGNFDYDNLFLVAPRASGEPDFQRLHYGAPSPRAPAAPAAMKRKP
ncbi:MAG TPA: phosphoglycerate mutase family protein [Elusimicrobiota bacterium]|jgi:broad specificity phosphatase PhoE|nr:phosphoglycerate mutase family protein [Elusimicrobiota bacterium]